MTRNAACLTTCVDTEWMGVKIVSSVAQVLSIVGRAHQTIVNLVNSKSACLMNIASQLLRSNFLGSVNASVKLARVFNHWNREV